jgi:hypothetical protein
MIILIATDLSSEKSLFGVRRKDFSTQEGGD